MSPRLPVTGKTINGLVAFIHEPILGFIMKIWDGATSMKLTTLVSGCGEMKMVGSGVHPSIFLTLTRIRNKPGYILI